MAPVAKPKQDLQKTFLRDWRRRRGLSQAEAAEKLMISRGLLSQLENAKTPYTQRLIENAASLYGCSPAEILAGPGLLNIDLLRQSISSIEEICLRMKQAPTVIEKAEMIVTFYTDSLTIIESHIKH